MGWAGTEISKSLVYLEVPIGFLAADFIMTELEK